MFNTYDEQGRRVTVTGCVSSRVEDEAIIRNLRFRWREELAPHNDAVIVNAYDEFASSDKFGNNDEGFLEWLADYLV